MLAKFKGKKLKGHNDSLTTMSPQKPKDEPVFRTSTEPKQKFLREAPPIMSQYYDGVVPRS